MAVLNCRFHTYIKQKNCNPNLIKRNTVTALSISLLSPSAPPCSDSAVLPSRLLLSPPVTISLGFRSSSTLAASYFTLKKEGKLSFERDMPKQKKYKNLLKAAAANSSQDKSVATVNSSQDKSIASNASQVKFLVAANSSRDKSAAAANSSRDKSAASNSSRDKSAASNSSRDKSTAVASSSRDKSAASNSSEPSSVAPTISEHPSEPKRKRGRESKHYWTVDAIGM
ncbi:uncharacterized protein [Arachis hypogaea]|uniref:uncharacterized protein n=1 Tax=Arachis hypogaea TaxID=3818 RepID=UPI003B214A96